MTNQISYSIIFKNKPFFIGFFLWVIVVAVLQIAFTQTELIFWVNRHFSDQLDTFFVLATKLGEDGLYVPVLIYLGFKKVYTVPFIGLICTGFGVFMYDDTPAIAIHFLSVIILFGFLTDSIKSLYLAPIMGGISGFLSLITKTVDVFSNSNTLFSQLRFNRSNAFSITIALLVTLIFGSIYASANPLFSDLLTFVTFTNYQINWELIMVILGGSIMMAAVFYPFRVEFVKTIEEKMPSVLSVIRTEIEDSEFLNALKTENKSGIIMLSMLNILILFFNLL